MFKSKKLDAVDTVIGKETSIEGNVKLSTSLRVDGKVYGAIECEGDLTIGKSGHVENTIRARNIHIAGTVVGDLMATEKVHILSSGKFTGKAEMKGLVIEEGGIFDGQSHMNSNQGTQLSQKPSKQETKGVDKKAAVNS